MKSRLLQFGIIILLAFTWVYITACSSLANSSIKELSLTKLDFSTGTSPGSNQNSNPVNVSMYYCGTYLSMGKDNQPHLIPFYWQGTTKTDLPVPEGTAITYLEGISVYNDTAYIAGYYCGANMVARACYWQGTARIDLPVPVGSPHIFSISVINGTVYIGGYYGGNGNLSSCYWRRAERMDLGAISLTGFVNPGITRACMVVK